MSRWPINPTSLIIEWLRRSVKPGSTIADLGCGEAHIAKQCSQKYKILSYDMVAINKKLVTEANIADLPLENGTVDVCVLSLALMGPDWPQFLAEAHRVLKERYVCVIVIFPLQRHSKTGRGGIKVYCYS